MNKELKIENWDKGVIFEPRGDNEVEFQFAYPRNNNKIKHLRVGIMDVRASDGIRISYDFERDGYVIEQPKYSEWESEEDYDERGYGWTEVAFIQSWALSEDIKTND